MTCLGYTSFILQTCSFRVVCQSSWGIIDQRPDRARMLVVHLFGRARRKRQERKTRIGEGGVPSWRYHPIERALVRQSATTLQSAPL